MRIVVRMAVVLCLTVGMPACSEKITTPDDFLPVFSNSWENVANQAHTFQLNSTDDGKATGAFDGNENHPTLGSSLIEGTFTNSVAQFTIKRNAGNLTYAGKFLHRDTLRLTRSGETLLLGRQ